MDDWMDKLSEWTNIWMNGLTDKKINWYIDGWMWKSKKIMLSKDELNKWMDGLTTDWRMDKCYDE